MFERCSKLSYVYIPDSVESIGGSAFRFCSSLTEIELPDHITCIGPTAFQNSGLEELSLPSDLTTINNNAFSGCSKLTNLYLNDKLTMVGQIAFRDCGGLKEISIPKGLQTIQKGAFSGCSSLTDVYYRGTEDEWENVNIDWQDYVDDFSGMRYINNILLSATIHYNQPGGEINNILTLPESLTTIESEAFISVAADAVRIPETVTFIADDAFDTGLIIIAPANSPAAEWAEEHHFELIIE